MRKSTAQKDLAGHTKQLRGPNVAAGHGLGSSVLEYLVPNNNQTAVISKASRA